MRGVASVLNAISQSEIICSDFTLIGGTALSLSIGHRLSEDLDFYSWDSSCHLESDLIVKNLSNLRKDYKISQLLNSEYQQDFLVEGVKVTFFTDPLGIMPTFEKKQIFNQFKIADIYSIAGMKTCVSLGRAKFRDYYDLFCLAHDHLSIREIIASALSFRPHFNSRIVLQNLTSLGEARDETLELLKPIYKISRSEIESLFRQISRPDKLNTQISKMDLIYKPEVYQHHIDFHKSQEVIKMLVV